MYVGQTGMTSDLERILSVADVLRLYAEGRRDFRKVDVSANGNTFENARLDDTDFSFSFIDANFAGASLRRSKFVHANVKACVFDRADLTGATFAGAAIDAATFIRSEVEGATFAGATSYSHAFLAGELPDERVHRGPSPGRHERFRRALASTDVGAALYALACDLRDVGETEQEVCGLFDLFRSIHDADEDETLYNAILDIMDCITGWCAGNAAIFKRSPVDR